MKTPTPKKTASGYRIQLRLNGASIPVTAPTAKECIRQAELIKAEHRAEKRLVSKNNITLRQAIDNYIAARDGVLSPSTIRGYDVIRRNRFQAYMDKPLRETKWQTAINEESKTVSAKTVYNSWCLVSSLLRENDLPVPKIVLPQIVEKEHLWLTPEQIPLFLDAINGKTAELPALLALHGLRCSEIYALDYDSIKDGVIKVRGATVLNMENKYVKKKENKNTASNRNVPVLIPRLNALLLERRNAGEPMLTYSPYTLWRAVDRICKSADLPGIGVHGLRHSFASLCYHLGLSERETMAIGGWKDQNTMRKIYTHISEADLKKANEKLAAFFAKKNDAEEKSREA